MALNLVDVINQRFDSAVVGQISSALGVSSVAAETAVRGAIPTALAGMLDKAAADDGAASLLGTLQRLDVRPGSADETAGLVRDDRESLLSAGADLVGSLFGRGAGDLADALDQLSGVGRDAAASVLNLVTPIAAGVVGKQQHDLGLDAGDLARLLGEQKQAVAQALPAGLRGALDLERLQLPEIRTETAATAPAAADDTGSSFWSVFLWIAVAVALGYIAYLFLTPGGGAQ